MRDDERLTIDYQSGIALARTDRRYDAEAEELGGLQDRILGDFVLDEVLGEGASGTVYRAEQRTLGRPAVVKVIRHAMAARRDCAERFVREARLASRFDHPYAAHVYAFGVEHDGLMWIAMELVDGQPLSQVIRQAKALTLDRFVPLFERLCDVVQSAHDQGIVHRDIKPSNVMVIARAGRLMPKLLDFGIARMLPGAEVGATTAETWLELEPAAAIARSAATCGITHEGQVLGSPVYMAPEQWRDPATAGPAADQYALAMLAYEAVTGAPAFASPGLRELERQHLDDPLPPLPPDLPPALHAVLARAADKAPERRFASLTELASAVRVAALGATAEIEPADAALPEQAPPYPGLAPFTAADGASFVGRERDVEQMLDRLRAHSIVTVVGPSGGGKTSFLAAGLIPALDAHWRVELIRPGSDPLGVLSAIAEQGDAPPYRERLQPVEPGSPSATAAALIGRAEVHDTSLLVIVDQAEELFTMCADDTRRAAFAEVLVRASASPRVRVVLALRDDFLCRIEQLPAWRGLLGHAVHVLAIPGPQDLERMVAHPARRRGFGFDDPALPREIVEQVGDRPGALPLIAFTAAQLWEHRDRQFRRLTREAYDRIGGVTGALAQHAEAVLERMPVADRRSVRQIFRRLITAEGARVLISRAELESAIGGGAGAVLDRLLAARLLVSHDGDDGDRIEVIHETLAATWPRLAAWRREDADGLRLQDQLAVAARHWHERGRPGDLLWRGDAVADLRRWQASGQGNLTPVEHAFARACVAAAGRARRVRIAIAASTSLALALGCVGLVAVNRTIAHQNQIATDRLRTGFEERGRAAIGEGDDARGLLYLAEASRLGARGPSFDLLASHALAPLDAGLEILGHDRVGIVALDAGGPAILTLGSNLALSRWDRAGARTRVADGVYCATLVGDVAISVSSQGDLVATDRDARVRWRADRAVTAPGARCGIAGSSAGHVAAAFGRTATLWEVETGRARGVLGPSAEVSAVAFDAGGGRAATGDVDGVVRIWNTETAAPIATCEPHAGAVRAVVFAADGDSVVSGGNDGDVRICDPATGATRRRLVGHNHQVLAVDVTRDGRSVVSGGRDGKPRIWDAQTGLLVRVLEGHHGAVTGVQFSPDAARILTLGLDGTARIWSRDGLALGSLQGHGGPIYGGRWDGDGRHVLTTSADGALRRWDAARAQTTTARTAHAGSITELAVSPDGRWLATAGADGRAVVWDRSSLDPIAELHHDAKVTSVQFAPDGASALTTAGGPARIWRLPAGTLGGELGAQVTAAVYLRDGRVVTAEPDRVRFWTARGGELGAVSLGHTADRLVIDPGQRWLFAAGAASAVSVIDLASARVVAQLAIRGRRVLGIASDATRVAIGDGTAIRIWQLGTWLPVAVLAGHKNPVSDLWFLPGGRLVSSAADAALVWDPDGRLRARLGDTSYVFALAASPDGGWFATTGSDGTVRIWDAATIRLLLQLPAHVMPAMALLLTPDGAAAISAGNDGRVVISDLAHRARTPDELARIVRCRVPLQLDGDVALPRDLAFDDPACRTVEERRR